MTKIAIHQANFIPNLPFFYKMAMVDKFVILINVDFEKNNFQNRYLLNEKERWVTKSVRSGTGLIKNKFYTDGTNLAELNIEWINLIAKTLDIKAEIVFDFETELKGTRRLIELIKLNGGDTYITNPLAKDKYLDEQLMAEHGIELQYCKVPKHLQIHIFEAFDKFGVDGTIKQLPTR